MSETEKKVTKKVAPKVVQQPAKKRMYAQGTFADKHTANGCDGYEIGYLEVTALHQWNKATDNQIFVEHPQSGKPTPIMITPGKKMKTWKRVFYKFENEYHKLTSALDKDDRGNDIVVENLERGYMTKWTPIEE